MTTSRTEMERERAHRYGMLAIWATRTTSIEMACVTQY